MATAWYNSHLKLNRPPVRGQRPTKVPTVILMTEDAANRQKAGKSGITSTSGLFPVLTDFFVPFFMFFLVRKYVEGMKDSTQLLDLLAAVGSEDMEPTRVAIGRQVLYPDVRFSSPIICFFFFFFFWPDIAAQESSHCDALAGVKAGELHQGHLNANQYNYIEGSALVPAFIKREHEQGCQW